MVNTIDAYWGSLHCVLALTVPLLTTQTYKWIGIMEQGGCVAEVTSKGELLIFFFLHPFPMNWNHLKLLLQGPSQPHLYLFTYKSLVIKFYLKHLEAKKNTETTKDKELYFQEPKLQ